MRIILKPREKRFLRYSAVGAGTFLIDLLLLWTLTSVAHVQYLVATAVSFLFAVSCNYFISRKHVFKHTERGVRKGYIYFMQFALVGMGATTFLMFLLANPLGLPLVYTRAIIACIVGIGNYLANLHLTFKVAGKHIAQ